MRLLDCHGRTALDRVRAGNATYIGRRMPGLDASPLRNPYVGKTAAADMVAAKRGEVIVVPDDAVIERYKRALTRAVIEGGEQREALAGLSRFTSLACWCATRPATLIGSGRPEPHGSICHGDVVFTVWEACEKHRIWREPTIDFAKTYKKANEAWSRLYQLAFAEPMQWGKR